MDHSTVCDHIKSLGIYFLCIIFDLVFNETGVYSDPSVYFVNTQGEDFEEAMWTSNWYCHAYIINLQFEIFTCNNGMQVNYYIASAIPREPLVLLRHLLELWPSFQHPGVYLDPSIYYL